MKLFIEILLFIGFITELTLGLFVYFKGKRKSVNKYFSGLMCGMAFWNLFFVLGIIFTSDLLIKISVVLGLFGTTFFLLFSKIFGEQKKFVRPYFLLIISLPLLLAPIVILSNLIIKDTKFYPNGFIETSDGRLTILFYLFHLVFSILGFYYIIKGYKLAKGIRKIQFQYLFFGLGIVLLIFIVSNLILPIFGLYHLISLSALSFIILAIFFLYLITRYRFMDIRLFIKKSLVYTITLAIILIVYTCLILFTQRILIEQYHWNSNITILLSVFIIALSVEPLRRLVIKLVNELFYSKKEKRRIELLKSKVCLTSIQELDKAIDYVVSDYLSAIESEKIMFLVRTKDQGYIGFYPKNYLFQVKPESALFQYLRMQPEILVKNEIPYLIENNPIDKKLLEKINHEMEKMSASIVLPVNLENKIYGLFLFGDKKQGDYYTKEDIDLLNHLRETIATPLVSAIMYKEAVERIVE